MARNRIAKQKQGHSHVRGAILALKMAQLIFAKFLWERDMGSWPKRKSKPDNMFMPGQLMPNLHAKIRVRKRLSE